MLRHTIFTRYVVAILLLRFENGWELGFNMRPVILVFARYYLPGYRAGGPIRSIANIVERLGDEFEFRIVTSDRDLGDKCAYPGIQYGTWVAQGNAHVHYVRPADFGLRAVAEVVRDTPHNAIYLNSFFDRRFTQQVLVNRLRSRVRGRPIVLAPRGEFSVGAMRLKRWQKLVGIRLARPCGLYNGLTWQASSLIEAEEIRRTLSLDSFDSLRGRVIVAGNISGVDPVEDDADIPHLDAPQASRNADAPLRICFLSRISPMKNLDYALRVLTRVRASVQFSIYGPAEDSSYWSICEAQIAALPPNIEVIYQGPIDHVKVVPTLAQHDLFLLPTRGENYGHVIAEALRAGLTLLASDRTPWRNLAHEGVGWDLPLGDESAFVHKIEEIATWSRADFVESGRRARALAARIADDPSIVQANRRLFLDTVACA